MLLKMCDIFLAELAPIVSSLGLNKRGSQDMMDRIKFMVNKIMAKAQRSLLAMGLVGCTITAGAKKDGELFTDMHAYATGGKESVGASWHLAVKPGQQRKATESSAKGTKLAEMNEEEEAEATQAMIDLVKQMKEMKHK